MNWFVLHTDTGLMDGYYSERFMAEAARRSFAKTHNGTWLLVATDEPDFTWSRSHFWMDHPEKLGSYKK